MDFEQELQQIARRYAAEGYTVVVNPGHELLPPFAAGHEVDILATKADQGVIAEVKRNRKGLAEVPRLSQLAEITNVQPGWRFDLVIVEPENPIEKAAEKAHEPSEEQLSMMLDKAREIAAVGYHDIALTYAWAGLEAAMRRVRDDVELYGGKTPAELLRTLYSNGFMSREEFDRAREALRIRTEIVHGFAAAQVSDALVNDIIALARKIMGAEQPAASPVAG
jgi:REase_AHJR-like